MIVAGSLRFWIIIVVMGFFGGMFRKQKGVQGMASSSATTTTTFQSSSSVPPSRAEVEDRLRGALWGFFAGDALAAPTHWYYGGVKQVIADYGHPITDYTKPNRQLAGSILNKSNLNGGGRSRGDSNSKSHGTTSSPKSIIGHVINHGKQDLWSPHQSIHYHATLQRGENTLEVQIARVLMNSIVTHQGRFDADHFRKAYVQFMTTPGSHNDTYASTCHRMFFANMIHKQLPLEQCPDNDMHNVDAMDGLVLPTMVALVDPNAAAECASVTRRSDVLENVSQGWGAVVASALWESNDVAFLKQLNQFSKRTIRRSTNPKVNDASTMSACYLEQSLPGMLDLCSKYLPSSTTRRNDDHHDNAPGEQVWQGLLANANIGGENVHRGSILGAIWGARVGMSQLPKQLIQGLHPHDELARDIEDFVRIVIKTRFQEECSEADS